MQEPEEEVTAGEVEEPEEEEPAEGEPAEPINPTPAPVAGQVVTFEEPGWMREAREEWKNLSQTLVQVLNPGGGNQPPTNGPQPPKPPQTETTPQPRKRGRLKGKWF